MRKGERRKKNAALDYKWLLEEATRAWAMSEYTAWVGSYTDMNWRIVKSLSPPDVWMAKRKKSKAKRKPGEDIDNTFGEDA